MKRLLFVGLISIRMLAALELTYNTQLSTPAYYANQAEHWAQDLARTTTPEEAERIANMLYFAWKRSAQTREAQELVARYLILMAEDLATFDSARLNPGQYVKYQTTYHDLTPLTMQLMQSLTHHRTTGMCYTHALDSLIKYQPPTNQEARTALTLIRNEVRTTVLLALGSLADNSKALAREVQTLLAEALALVRADDPTRGIVQDALESFGSLFIQTFAQSDAALTEAQKRTFKALLLARQTHTATWHVMESVRQAFYQAHYTALYTHLTQRRIRFSPEGITQACPQELPDPASLFT